MYKKASLWIVDSILVLWSLWCVYNIPTSPILLISVTVLPLIFIYAQFEGMKRGKSFADTQFVICGLVTIMYGILTAIAFKMTGLVSFEEKPNAYDFSLMCVTVIALVIFGFNLIMYSITVTNCVFEGKKIDVYSTISEKIVNWVLFTIVIGIISSIFLIENINKYIMVYMATWILICSIWVCFHVFNDASSENSKSDFTKVNVIIGTVSIIWVSSIVYSLAPTSSIIGIVIVPISVLMTFSLNRLIKKLLTIKGKEKVSKEHIDTIVDQSKRNLSIKH